MTTGYYVWRGKPPPNPCGCGCGGDAGIATKTDRRYGHVRGQPKRYIAGHNQAGDHARAANAARAARGWPGTR